jgi:putative Mn2+ efflux pump MntP
MQQMGLVTIFIIAVGLAMDSFAVAIVEGGAYKKLHLRHAFHIAVLFGLFQAFMPVVGYFCGTGIKEYIDHYDHWVAFFILAAIGSKMIYESTKINSTNNQRTGSGPVMLMTLSVATSIDALAVGITLGLVHSSIALAALVIGAVTFVLSYAGVYIGHKFGHFFESKIEAAGGIVLIAIGLKILLEHFTG